jgi:hypothetical protein
MSKSSRVSGFMVSENEGVEKEEIGELLEFAFSK